MARGTALRARTFVLRRRADAAAPSRGRWLHVLPTHALVLLAILPFVVLWQSMLPLLPTRPDPQISGLDTDTVNSRSLVLTELHNAVHNDANSVHEGITDDSAQSDGSDGAVPEQRVESPTQPESAANIYKEITFTNIGWFQPNATAGLETVRSLTGKDFVDAVLAHERYNGSAWEDLERNPDPARPIVAFLDVETCGDFLWPHFGGDWTSTSDTASGRAPMRKGQNKDVRAFCPAAERALRSPAMSAPESRLVVLSCEMGGRPRLVRECAYKDRDPEKFAKLVVGHLTAHKEYVHPHDFGVPPLPVKPVTLSPSQRNDVETCRPNSRKYRLSFIGRPRFPEFQEYMTPLHGKHGTFVRFTRKHYDQSPLTNLWGTKMLVPLPPENQTQDVYYSLLMDSYYAPSPRGDDLYSIRFSEIMSAAAIPIVYADGWVLPYTKDVVNWTDLAILLPQQRVNETLDAIASISDSQRCKMQQEALRFYENYVADSRGRLRAILKIMDARLNQGPSEVANFTFAPGNSKAPLPVSRLRRLKKSVVGTQNGGDGKLPS